MIRILIVDDQKSVRENIKLMLSAEPQLQIVGTADNGYKGIEMAEMLEPDVILMDLEMPKLDGLMATKIISQKNSALNVIILTIKDENELLLQSLNSGARGYLLKNADVKEIVNTIKLVYEGNRQENHQNGKSYTPRNISDRVQPQIDIPSSADSGLSSNTVSQFNVPNPILESNLSWETLGNPSVLSGSRSNFDIFLAVLKRRYPPALIGFFSVLVGAILYLTFAKRTYQTTASLILQDRQESISELGRDLSSIQESQEYSPLASQIESIRSRSVIGNALRNVELPKDSSGKISLQQIQQVQDALAISVIPNTNIIQISYVDEDPEFAAKLLNEIVIAVREKNTQSIREEASSVRKFLEQEIAKQKNEVAQIKAAENSYRQEQGIVSLDNQTSNLVNNLSELEIQSQELSTQIKEQESKVNNLKRVANVNDAQSAYIEGKVGQDSQLEELRQRLTDIDARLAAARANFTDNNPAVIDLKEEKASTEALYQQQIDRLVDGGTAVPPSKIARSIGSQTKDGIGERVLEDLIANQIQLDADRDKLQAVRAEISNIEAKIALLPAKVQSLTDLVSQQEQASESLQFLQRKLEEAKIAEAQLITNLQIAENATVPSAPYAPNVPVVLAIAIFMATILMAAITLLLEKIDRTLYDGVEIEQDLNLPLLAALPNLSECDRYSDRITTFLKDKALYEPYRFLSKRLESYGPNGYKAIVVTSASAGEGKSTVAFHLGIVSAMLSKRTLIVDAHLHAPQQHKFLQAKLQPGLKELVSGGLDWYKAVQTTKIKNLSLLASGSSGSDSWMVLESPQMKKILQEASLKYDLIIIDTPPVDNSCDAYTLSNYSSGMIMVTRPLYTSRDVLEQTVSDLKRNNASIIGFVINNANKQKSKSKPDSIPPENSQKIPALYGSSSKPAKNSRRRTEGVR